MQQMLELDARGGTRYAEYVLSHFGVQNSDLRMQRSEYLGGTRQPINVSSVPQTSNTTQITPQGNLAAYSVTGISHKSVRARTFNEHGFLIGVACVRYHHTYQQNVRYF